MSAESEAADLAVREGMAIAESTAKLAALGAKNLAALVMALATNEWQSDRKGTPKSTCKRGARAAYFFAKRARPARVYKGSAKIRFSI